MTENRPLPRLSLKHGLSAEVLSDRSCADTLDAAMQVHRALGIAHAAATYKGALAVELTDRGRRLHRDATFSVLYKRKVVGSFTADLLVDDRLLVQVVADPTLTNAHKTEALRGLAAGGVEVGLVFNFGLSELFFSRIL